MVISQIYSSCGSIETGEADELARKKKDHVASARNAAHINNVYLSERK